MIFPDPSPSPPDLYTFSSLLDGPREDDSMEQWAQAAGYVQHEPVDENFDFESLDALFLWGQGGALPKPTPDSELGGGLGLDWATPVVGDMPTLDHLAAAPFAATSPLPAPSPLVPDIDFDLLLDLPEWDSTLSLTPGAGSVTSPRTDSTGDQLLPSPTYEATASQFVPSSATPLPDIDFTGVFQAEHVACTLPSWLIGDGFDFGGQMQAGSSSIPDLMSTCGNAYFETIPDTATPVDVTSTTGDTRTERVGASGTVLGKRSRKGGYDLPLKRAKPTTDGVLEAAGSTKRTRRTPAIRTQTTINSKSKAVGRGAEMLASTTARGVYCRSLLGPSVLQGSAGALALGHPSWTEEREQEKTRHDTDSTLTWLQQIEPQQPEITEGLEGLHAIPRALTAWQRLLLQTTQADVERGAVSVIKCRLCPTEGFKTWACFNRHCRDCEEHPAVIKCCERCGIYFGRQDSKKRHTESATKACCGTSPDEAAWRKHRAEQLLAAFKARVEYCLRTGEELGPKFAAIAMEALPSRSKKVISSRKIKSRGDDS